MISTTQMTTGLIEAIWKSLKKKKNEVPHQPDFLGIKSPQIPLFVLLLDTSAFERLNASGSGKHAWVLNTAPYCLPSTHLCYLLGPGVIWVRNPCNNYILFKHKATAVGMEKQKLSIAQMMKSNLGSGPVPPLTVVWPQQSPLISLGFGCPLCKREAFAVRSNETNIHVCVTTGSTRHWIKYP